MAFDTVTTDLTIGQIGQLGAPIEPFGSAQSYPIAADSIPPGYGVVVAGDTVELPSDGADTFAGAAFIDGSLPIEAAGYGTDSGVINAPVAKVARVWVATTQAVNASDGVFLQFDGSGAGPAGTFRADADGGKAFACPGCAWDHSASSGKALLRINLPA